MVTVGEAITLEVLDADKLAEGDQAYVDAPEAVNVTLFPVTIVEELGDTVIVGRAFTVTDTATF